MLIEFPIEMRQGPKGPIKENMLINVNKIDAVLPESGESTQINVGNESYIIAMSFKKVKEKLRIYGV